MAPRRRLMMRVFLSADGAREAGFMTHVDAHVLSESDLSLLVGVLKGSASVELKATVPDDAVRSAVAALGMDALDAQLRQVFFFESPDLALQAAGVVVRAPGEGSRRRQRREVASGRARRAS